MKLRFTKTVNHVTDSINPFGQGITTVQNDSHRRVVDIDTKYGNLKAIFDQTFRQAEGLGVDVIDAYGVLLVYAQSQVSRGEIPGRAISLERPLIIGAQDTALHTLRSSENGTTGAFPIRNPAVRRNNRGSYKRKRAFHERRGRRNNRSSSQNRDVGQNRLEPSNAVNRAINVLSTND